MKVYEAEKVISLWEKYHHYIAVKAERFDYELKKLPTVEAEPVRHGHWIDEGLYNDDSPYHAWRCSECGEYVIEIGVPWYKFCPDCGAKMDGAERKEE